jgi:hypothetical protein
MNSKSFRCNTYKKYRRAVMVNQESDRQRIPALRSITTKDLPPFGVRRLAAAFLLPFRATATFNL